MSLKRKIDRVEHKEEIVEANCKQIATITKQIRELKKIDKRSLQIIPPISYEVAEYFKKKYDVNQSIIMMHPTLYMYKKHVRCSFIKFFPLFYRSN